MQRRTFGTFGPILMGVSETRGTLLKVFFNFFCGGHWGLYEGSTVVVNSYSGFHREVKSLEDGVIMVCRCWKTGLRGCRLIYFSWGGKEVGPIRRHDGNRIEAFF